MDCVGQFGTEQLALVGPLHAPSAHEYVAEPVAGAVESVNVALPPLATAGRFSVQVFDPTVQLTEPAGHEAAHEALVGEPQLPLLQLKLAEPVAGIVLSVAAMVFPFAVDPTLAEHVSPPTVQDRVVAGQFGIEQLAPLGALHVPSLQVKVAEPVCGSAESVSVWLAPLTAADEFCEQVFEPTVQLSAVAPHEPAHAALVGAPHVPALHVTFAVPVSGIELSASGTVVPLVLAGAVALHVSPPTVHEMACAGQLGTVQDVLVGAPQVPSEHATFADPVVGVVVSLKPWLPPETVAGTVSEHVLLPTVQLMVPAGHEAAQDADVGAPHVPALQVTDAEPVPGIALSVSGTVVPLELAGAFAEHVSPPTVQLID